MFVPSCNRIAAMLGNVITVIGGCLILSLPRRNVLKLDMFTVVMASWLTMFVPSLKRTAALLDSAVTVTASCLTVGMARVNKRTLD